MIFSRRRRKRRSAENVRRRNERRLASGRKPAKQSLRRSAKLVCVCVSVCLKKARVVCKKKKQRLRRSAKLVW